MARGACLLAAVLVLGACTGGPSTPATSPSPSPSPTGPAAAPEQPAPAPAPPAPTPAWPDASGGPVVVAEGLDVPWGLAFLPDGSALVTLRDSGEVVQVRAGAAPRVVGTVPGVVPGGEGGLLGIAVSPGFAQDRRVFVYLSAATDNRVLRMRLDGELVPDRVVVEGIPRAGNHNGGRLAFGPDGFLYVTTGDAQRPANAQDRASLGGKILRVDADGAPAPGNPFGSAVWSLGHRNVQGLDWADDGTMYASEFGQNTWDELNVITPGANYGWPDVEGSGDVAGYTDPVAQWRTGDASPSGIAVAGDAVYLAALRGEALWRVPRGGGEPQRLLHEAYGRLRAVETDGTGNLWVLTSNTFRGEPRPGDDQVVVLDPATLGEG
ncbi:PQQ-dependent sugar dehydrogenase [Georgenia sp. AZ-5]|uniref:PQQ-dependent sugar dehydrogenase n=1 Tax=Georgenia sp. AZ-5 TaxID=3367526 RepID=UPI003754A19C